MLRRLWRRLRTGSWFERVPPDHLHAYRRSSDIEVCYGCGDMRAADISTLDVERMALALHRVHWEDAAAMTVANSWADPRVQVEYERVRRRERIASALTDWLRTVPIVGHYVASFWHCIIAEGVRETCAPRWGTVTFAYLNDGIRPSLWHTWYSMTHDNMARFSGIYPKGAPRSRAEASAYEEGDDAS